MVKVLTVLICCTAEILLAKITIITAQSNNKANNLLDKLFILYNIQFWGDIGKGGTCAQLCVVLCLGKIVENK